MEWMRGQEYGTNEADYGVYGNVFYVRGHVLDDQDKAVEVRICMRLWEPERIWVELQYYSGKNRRGTWSRREEYELDQVPEEFLPYVEHLMKYNSWLYEQCDKPRPVCQVCGTSESIVWLVTSSGTWCRACAPSR